MKNFLLEVYTDEIPAKILNSTLVQLRESFEQSLRKYRLKTGNVKTFGTMKRLCAYVEDIEEKEDDSVIEIKGPPAKAAFSEAGEKLPAYVKFLESKGLSEKDVEIRKINVADYVFGLKKVEGRKAKDIIREVALEAISSLSFPRTMRWESTNTRFIRPIKNILALFGDEVVEFSFAGVSSNNKSYGFFFEAPLEFEVSNPTNYFVELRSRYVICEYEERKRLVEKKIASLLEKVGGAILCEDDFLEEVINLTEFPTPFLASFGDIKPTIPDCVIESVVKDHMKSIPVVSKKTGTLLPFFIGVRNGTSDFIENVKRGYEKVVKARILDAEFFFKEDMKRPLESRLDDLKDIIFMKDLGSMMNKTQRLEKLANFVSGELRLSSENATSLQRAARLSKCDLTTSVVREFPELQGKIGGIYASADGEKEEVSCAIADHYLPRFPGDALPRTLTGKLLSLIDKLDSVVGSVLSGVEFSSSKDPFGIRRMAAGIVEILMSMEDTSFPCQRIVKKAKDIYVEDFPKITGSIEQVQELLYERTETYLRERGIEYDVINAIKKLDLDYIPTFLERAMVISDRKKDEDFRELCLAHKRIRNIISKAEFPIQEVDDKYLFDEAEIRLFSMVVESETLTESLLKDRDYEALIRLLYLLNPEIARFFDNVLVMDENEKIRYNRLNLLLRLKNLLERFAGFSEIIIAD